MTNWEFVNHCWHNDWTIEDLEPVRKTLFADCQDESPPFAHTAEEADEILDSIENE